MCATIPQLRGLQLYVKRQIDDIYIIQGKSSKTIGHMSS